MNFLARPSSLVEGRRLAISLLQSVARGRGRCPSSALCSRSAIVRYFSSSTAQLPKEKIAIHYATSTGTSQLFAHELQQALEEKNVELGGPEISMASLGDISNVDDLDPQALHLIIISTSGVGEAPTPAMPFCQSVEQLDDKDETSALTDLQFGVFGLGNSAAHPHHYNTAGKTLHAALVARQASPWLPLTLGDDSVCIEEDFDMWQAAVLGKLKAENDPHEACDEMKTTVIAGLFTGGAISDDSLTASVTTDSTSTSVTDAKESSQFSWKRLELVPFESTEADELRTDLWDAHPTFYHADCQRWSVVSQKSLNQQPTANALHELELQAMNTGTKNGQTLSSYEAGDHLVVYPAQQDFLVEAYLEHWHLPAAMARSSLVEKVQHDDDSTPYPHPVGISLYDTLRYCVDLTAPPGPRFARLLTGREDLHYKQDIFDAHATPLSLIKQYQSTISLEDLLYQLPPTQPRYYSIASSPLVHPDRLILTYRSVRYLTGQGSLQQGLCTSYLEDLQSGSTLMAYVNHNPSFRLPTDVSRPVIMLAGGCGVAAIRALVEEIQARPVDKRPPVYLWVGFRDPADAAYVDLMRAIQPELLEVTYSASCRRTDGKCALVSDRLADMGELVYDLLQHQGAYLYACGGARTFGAAIQRELHGVYETHGGCDADGAQAALQQLVSEGRYCEDLAD